MPTRFLILTVGGSCAPIVCAIRHHGADHVYFVCSAGNKGSSRLVDGPGDACGDPHGKSIVAQTGLTTDRYRKFEIQDPDDLADCYATVHTAFADALALDPDARIIADYTGGTKTMTAALVRVATGRYADRASLFVVTGPRDQLRVVRDGLEAAQSQDAAALMLDEPFQEALRLTNAYHYAAAGEILRRILGHVPPPPQALRRQAQRLLVLCQGLDAWDRFDHAEATRLLQPEAALLETIAPGSFSTLRALAGNRTPTAGAPASVAGAGRLSWGAVALLPVYDLLLNAERRAQQGRYDDAVARHYRALELLAQNRLRAQFGIDPSSVDPAVVATWLAGHPTKAQESPLRIGLKDCYDVLASLNDPLGVLWTERSKALLNVLSRRNQSILAHGLDPVRQEEYAALRDPIWRFVERAVSETGAAFRQPAQFPQVTQQAVQ